MAGSIFLFGDQHGNFAETSRPFIEAAGGASAKIAMLTEGGEMAAPYVARITAPWQGTGVEVVVLGPAKYAGEPDEAMARKLRECSGIFMCGGETRNYQRIYVGSMLGDIIRERYREGVPYAGVSAGALLAAGDCALWGGVVTTPTNEYYVRYRGCYDLAEGDVELQIGKGLGLLQDCIFEPHFAELGGFPRLATVMERTGATDGYGLDDPICLVFEGGKPARALGRGRLYHLRRQDERKFELEVHEPGEELH